jgi:hypothetical protein
MKLAWYTPYSKWSAIGAFSREVIEALTESGHEVTLVRSECRESYSSKDEMPSNWETLWAGDIDRNLESWSKNFDFVIYNLGNHLGNHHFAVEHQWRVPGITVLHDYLLHNLLYDWAHRSEVSYVDILENEASEAAVVAYTEAAKSDVLRDWFMSRAVDFPILKFFVSNSQGIVTHGDFYRSIADEAAHCPTSTIPLAYPFERELALPEPVSPDGRFRLLTIGDVNMNKRCESVIQALGSNETLSRQWEYRIVGNCTKAYQLQLQRKAAQCRFPVSLVMMGRLEESALHAELSACQAVSCLRHPVIEGASASVIVGLAGGRPLLISPGGCYSEIPESLIHRVSLENEIGDISNHLENIAGDFVAARRRSIAARQWVASRHSGRCYADRLLEFLIEVRNEACVMRVVDRIGDCLASWQCPSDAHAVERIQRIVRELFPADTTSSIPPVTPTTQ